MAVAAEGASTYANALAPHGSLYIKQTRKGCLQELLGCDANSEFKIATKEDPKTDLFYAIEETNFCIRLVCKNQRPLTMSVHNGPDASAPVMLTIDRPFRCPYGSCKCCCFQEISVKDAATGTKLGGAKEKFYCCPVPLFQVLEGDKALYDLQMPTCCGGFCVNVCKEGLCNCKIPFYLYEPGKRDAELGSIIKEWGGLGAELFTTADKFSVTFPEGATPETKAAIWSAVMLLDYNFFEKRGGVAGGGAPKNEEMER